MPQRPPIHRVPWHRPREQRERERKERFDAQRPGSAERGYDRDWRRLRGLFLYHHPGCSVPGCSRPATDVDHIKDVRHHPNLRLEWSNLRAYCHRHHSQRTARDQGFARRPSSGR
jgi:5-methylcytosine-specific restriction endonuclease McrA